MLILTHFVAHSPALALAREQDAMGGVVVAAVALQLGPGVAQHQNTRLAVGAAFVLTGPAATVALQPHPLKAIVVTAVGLKPYLTLMVDQQTYVVVEELAKEHTAAGLVTKMNATAQTTVVHPAGSADMALFQAHFSGLHPDTPGRTLPGIDQMQLAQVKRARPLSSHHRFTPLA